jgi:predicted TIM-barrel fold metal-dependent hydrolase
VNSDGCQPPDRAKLIDLPLRAYAPVPALRRVVTPVDRSPVPAVDAHNHLGRWLTPDGGWAVPDVPALLDLMDEVGVTAVVNLDGRWGSELEANLDRYDRAHPGRFATFCHLDWSALQGPNPARTLIRGLEAARAAGARGVKVWKDLGLAVEDGQGRRVLPDDPRLAEVFTAAGELGLPVLIHTADPLAFFQPLDRHNERLEELLEHPDWWFGGPGQPSFDRLLAALEAVVAEAPGTTFVGAHVGCAAEDLAWVDRMLATYPNFHIDLGGRMAELGRQPRAARRLLIAHPDRVLFGTDAFPPDREAYRTWFRFLATDDECFAYAPDCPVPPQGRWEVSALDLPADTLAAVYAGNARRVLGLG